MVEVAASHVGERAMMTWGRCSGCRTAGQWLGFSGVCCLCAWRAFTRTSLLPNVDEERVRTVFMQAWDRAVRYNLALRRGSLMRRREV